MPEPVGGTAVERSQAQMLTEDDSSDSGLGREQMSSGAL